MQKKIQIFMKKHHMIERGDHIVTALSGGADSVCLLLLLHRMQQEMGFDLSAVHVEHGIRGAESLADASFCQELCRTLGISLRVFSVDVPAYQKSTHQTLEEAARTLRYQCFARMMAECGAGKLALAHHSDDCAETMLFHLCRGSGLKGLSGIAPVRATHQETGSWLVIRPLLAVSRREIEEWLRSEGQEYVIDSTNADTDYARNRIRNLVMPNLCQVNQQAVAHMVRTAEELRQTAEYLEGAAAKEGTACCRYEDDEVRILEQPWIAIPVVLQKILVHQTLERLAGSRKDIGEQHIALVLDLFAHAVGRSISLPYGLAAERTYDGIKIGKKRKNKEEGQKLEVPLPIPGELFWNGGFFDASGELSAFEPLIFVSETMDFDGNLQNIPRKAYTKWFDYDKIESDILLRNRRSGDRIQTACGGGHKKLKDYFIDAKIPQKERDRCLLLADGSRIIWILGQRISEAYKVTEQTRRVLAVQVKNPEQDDEAFWDNHPKNHAFIGDDGSSLPFI